jgi:ATPase subunit of ABC transporter with duplicated ATPase domains
LDLESITAVNEGLVRYKGALLFTSHDREFIQTVANRIIYLDGKVKEDKQISYEEFLGLEV